MLEIVIYYLSGEQAGHDILYVYPKEYCIDNKIILVGVDGLYEIEVDINSIKEIECYTSRTLNESIMTERLQDMLKEKCVVYDSTTIELITD